MTGMGETIRGVLDAYGKLMVPSASLADHDDLYQNGLSSHASVNVMLAVENAFGVEFPDSLLKKGTFQSVSAIREALVSLGVSPSQSAGD